MSLFNWLKRPKQPAPAASRLTPEQRGPTTIRHAGVTVPLPFQWTRATNDQSEPGCEEYHNTVLPEQLFITPRSFTRRVESEELRSVLASLADHYRKAVETLSKPAIDPPDFRVGSGQMELRIFARAVDTQVAFLHRGDPGRVVTVSLYRYADASKLDLREYATNIFDLAQFEPSPSPAP